MGKALVGVLCSAFLFLGIRLALRGELPETIATAFLYFFSAGCLLYTLWALGKIIYRIVRFLKRM